MKPLIVLLISFLVASIANKLWRKTYRFELSARIAMSVMLCFTAIGHFVFTKGMSMMIPPFIPLRTTVVYLTGIFEIVLALGLLVPRWSVFTGWTLIVFLILMLPGNIYAAMHHVNYQTGTFDGPGVSYLWFRIPLQILFIIWTYVSSVRNRAK